MATDGASGGGATLPRGSRRAPARAPLAARLVVVHPGPVARNLGLDGGGAVLGRDDGDGVLGVGDATVSRRHLAIEWDAAAGEHVARDLDSTNGSALDGEPLTGPRPLHDGCVVRVGDVLLVYEQWRGAAAGDEPASSRDAVPGEAAAIVALRARLARAAPDPSPVLVLGETGTGKERLAAELHARSGRKGAYLRINCAALSPQLVESQLFGHERGAFSGAGAAQPGVLREADGGTVLLDEIGDLPLDLQPKLLRALQEGEVLPVGASRPVRVDVRVVAATHHDLARAVDEGRFRRDLHARLAMWELRVPPLRQRRVDLLPWLARLDVHFRERRGATRAALAFEADAAEALLCAPWPDNLRGLDRLVHELAAADHHGPIALHDLPAWVTSAPAASPSTSPSPSPSPSGSGTLAAEPAPRAATPTREEFLDAHRAIGGNVTALARHFRRDRRQIYRWLEAFGLRPPT